MKHRATSFAHGRLELDSDEVPTIIDADMKRFRKCAHCGVTYQEYKNVGSWECTWHTHPYDQDRKTYPCCNTNTSGCQAGDHYENALLPFPGCETGLAALQGMPAFKLCEGNLKELVNVYAEAIQRLPDYNEQKRAVGDAVVVYVYRRCLFGAPQDVRYGN